MNTHLIIPADIQEILDNIENTSLHLAELRLEPHPVFSKFDRSIRVLDIDTKSVQQFIYFRYEQVLKDSQTGQEVKISLPLPEWVIYKETWSILLDDDFTNPIELPLKEPTEEITQDRVKVPAYKYMLWLLKNDNVRFSELLNHYLQEFVKTHQNELDKIS